MEGAILGEIDLPALIAAGEPVILKGVGRDLPLVRHGLQSADAALDYILSFYGGRQVAAFTGPASIGGRFFYDEAMTAMNFAARSVRLDDCLAELRAHRDDPDAPSFYVGSTDLDAYLPGLRSENELVPDAAPLGPQGPLASIWIGNRTVAATHWDMSNNMAMAMVGRRRFTLFPPDQIGNLYPGPLEPTPAGQVVSMVDARAPDLDRFPRFAAAADMAQVADLEPGDLLVYPALWWHQVEALDAVNVLINYWWNDAPAFVDTPMTTLLHGLLSLRDRPAPEKEAWRVLFDYYVFGDARHPAEHLPTHTRGALAPLDAMAARRLRAQLIQRLNR
jgi:hypothetical protein